MITLPVYIQNDLTKFISNKGDQISPYNAFKIITINNLIYKHLHKWLFNVNGYSDNQVKFIIYLNGGDYKFIDTKFIYSAKSGQVIGINEQTKQYTIGAKADFIRNELTRDEILDSPFDVNKLIEVPYDEKENIN